MIPELMVPRMAAPPLPDAKAASLAGATEAAFGDLVDGIGVKPEPPPFVDARPRHGLPDWPVDLTGAAAMPVVLVPVSVVAAVPFVGTGDAALVETQAGDTPEATGKLPAPHPAHSLPPASLLPVVAPDQPLAVLPDAARGVAAIGVPAPDHAAKLEAMPPKTVAEGADVTQGAARAIDPPLLGQPALAEKVMPQVPDRRDRLGPALPDAGYGKATDGKSPPDVLPVLARPAEAEAKRTPATSAWVGPAIGPIPPPEDVPRQSDAVPAPPVQTERALPAVPVPAVPVPAVPVPAAPVPAPPVPAAPVPAPPVPAPPAPAPPVPDSDALNRIPPDRPSPGPSPAFESKTGTLPQALPSDDPSATASASAPGAAQAPARVGTVSQPPTKGAMQADATGGSAQPRNAASLSGLRTDTPTGTKDAVVPMPDRIAGPLPESPAFAPSDPALPLRHDLRPDEARHPARPLPPTVAPMLVEAARALPDAPVTLTLAPEDLGALRFEMQSRGDTIHVSLTVERPETLDMLRRHVEQLTGEFRQAGFANASFSFAGGWGGGQERPSGAGYASRSGEDEEHPVARASKHVNGGLDLRL